MKEPYNKHRIWRRCRAEETAIGLRTSRQIQAARQQTRQRGGKADVILQIITGDDEVSRDAIVVMKDDWQEGEMQR
jgi:hypothetical protein